VSLPCLSGSSIKRVFAVAITHYLPSHAHLRSSPLRKDIIALGVFILRMSTRQYGMCSEQECHDRQANKEVSVFECVDPNAPIHTRTIDPCLAVAKYRRSAAGSVRSYPCRSMIQLEATVDHLLGLLVANSNAHATSDSTSASLNLLDAVRFVEDRLVCRRFSWALNKTYT
jgi:hypothetical protein